MLHPVVGPVFLHVVPMLALASSVRQLSAPQEFAAPYGNPEPAHVFGRLGTAALVPLAAALHRAQHQLRLVNGSSLATEADLVVEAFMVAAGITPETALERLTSVREALAWFIARAESAEREQLPAPVILVPYNGSLPPAVATEVAVLLTLWTDAICS